MVGFIARVIWRGIAGTVFVGSILFYFSVDLQRPRLPKTRLAPEVRSTYRYSLKKMVAARADHSVGVSLSVRETSYLLELLLPKSRFHRFEVVDVHFEGRGKHARVQLVAQGPFDLFYRLDWTGTLQLRDGTWTVRNQSLTIGRLAIGWILPSRSHPRWPTDWINGKISLKQAELDGRGLRASVHRFDVPVRLMIDRDAVPLLESAGIFQPGGDAVDGKNKGFQHVGISVFPLS